MNEKCREWMMAYIRRLRERGMTFEEAKDNYNAGCPHDLGCDFPNKSCKNKAVQWCPTLRAWLCRECATRFGCFDNPIMPHPRMSI